MSHILSNINFLSRFAQNIYPSAIFANSYRTNTPTIFAGVVALTFVPVAVDFLRRFCAKQNEKIIASASKTNAIVSSLFPDIIRERLMRQNDSRTKEASQRHVKSFLLDDGGRKTGGIG
jgi:hypothetical protein